MLNETSYVYRIDFEDGSWYWGVRLCPEGVKPEDDKYFGSPVTHKEKWKLPHTKTILREFSDFTEAGKYEASLIKDYLNDERCLNENCAGVISRLSCSKGGKKAAEKSRGKPRPKEIRKKIAESHKGKKLSAEHIEKLKTVSRPPRKPEQIAKQIESRKKNGKPWHSEETRKKIGEAQLGRGCPTERREKIAQTIRGRKWFNNGELEVQSHTCPEGWKPGRVYRPRIRNRN